METSNISLDNTQIIGIIASMIFSAFFSGVEMAFVSSNKLYFELKAKQDILSAKIIANFNQFPSRFIGTMLIVIPYPLWLMVFSWRNFYTM